MVCLSCLQTPYGIPPKLNNAFQSLRSKTKAMPDLTSSLRTLPLKDRGSDSAFGVPLIDVECLPPTCRQPSLSTLKFTFVSE